MEALDRGAVPDAHHRGRRELPREQRVQVRSRSPRRARRSPRRGTAMRLLQQHAREREPLLLAGREPLLPVVVLVEPLDQVREPARSSQRAASRCRGRPPRATGTRSRRAGCRSAGTASAAGTDTAQCRAARCGRCRTARCRRARGTACSCRCPTGPSPAPARRARASRRRRAAASSPPGSASVRSLQHDAVGVARLDRDPGASRACARTRTSARAERDQAVDGRLPVGEARCTRRRRTTARPARGRRRSRSA